MEHTWLCAWSTWDFISGCNHYHAHIRPATVVILIRNSERILYNSRHNHPSFIIKISVHTREESYKYIYSAKSQCAKFIQKKK